MGATLVKQFLPRDFPIGQIGVDRVSLGLPKTRGQWRHQTKEAVVRVLDKGGMNKLMGDPLGELSESKGRRVEHPLPHIGEWVFHPEWQLGMEIGGHCIMLPVSLTRILVYLIHVTASE